MRNNRTLFQLLCWWEIPFNEKISLWNISSWNPCYVNNFLKYSIPFKQSDLSLNFESPSIIDISTYLDSLRLVVPQITQKLDLQNFNISNEEFSLIILFSSHLKFIQFDKWNINSDSEWKFSNVKSSRLWSISFEKSGDKEYSDWDSKPYRFTNILKGIKSWNALISSLKRINIADCGIKKKQGSKLLKEYFLSNIQFQYR